MIFINFFDCDLATTDANFAEDFSVLIFAFYKFAALVHVINQLPLDLTG